MKDRRSVSGACPPWREKTGTNIASMQGVPVFAMQCVGYDPGDFLNHYYAYDFRGKPPSKTTHSDSSASLGNGSSPSTSAGSTHSTLWPSLFGGATSSTTTGRDVQALPGVRENETTRIFSLNGLPYETAERLK